MKSVPSSRVKVEKKVSVACPGPALRGIVHDQFALPFAGLSRILGSTELRGVDRLGIIENDAPLEWGHDHQCSVGIEKFQILPPRHGFGSLTSGKMSAGWRGSNAPAGIMDSSPVVVPWTKTSQRYRPAFRFGENPWRRSPGPRRQEYSPLADRTWTDNSVVRASRIDAVTSVDYRHRSFLSLRGSQCAVPNPTAIPPRNCSWVNALE